MYSVIHLLVVDVSFVLFGTQSACMVPKQNTRNIYHKQMNNGVLHHNFFQDNKGMNALTVAIINRERDCARAILESDDWLEALKTDVPDVLGRGSMAE